ncbi:RNA polymerase sigma-70 factor [Cohnella yongneupensis]|uniref:RNA polymerase sigma-70 factor n=1 Tax=Cohnella yongneupensis TaxID=425006 RepID=A0ABW0QVJ0_9BACL
MYRTYKPLLLSIAYRMLGSVTDAEDLVQDTFVTAQQVDENTNPIRNLKAYLCKTVTNRCIDFLKSARKKREVYVGPWLPEPLVQTYGGESTQDPLQTVVLEDTISYAFLVMLDRLTPVERAVFILREAFGYDYREIAEFINKTELGCRKIYSRLNRKIQVEPTDEPPAPTQSDELVLRFLHATSTGDMESLFAMLAEDIVLYSDGGGKAFAAINPIVSSKRVIAFILGLATKDDGLGEVRLVRVNGQLGFVLSSPTNPPPSVISLEIENNRIGRIYLVRNPDKLRHLNLG